MLLLFAVPHGVQVGNEDQTQVSGGHFIGRYRVLPYHVPQGHERADDRRGKTDSRRGKHDF